MPKILRNEGTEMENKNGKVWLIGNSHIDIVWQWQWQDGLQEIKATFRSVLDRMKEFPAFKFTCAGALYYEWIENTDAAMFSEISERVKEGRWCIAGGWYLQPDCNLPCGEAFAREGLIAQKYFFEKFGVTAKVGYNVDSFGHNGGLPQILKKSGLDRYVFMRPDENEKKLPADLFDWEGQDGSLVRTYRIPYAYGIEKTETIEKIKERAETENLPLMAFFGMGNHGGGPTIKLLGDIEALKKNDAAYEYGTVNEYFESVKSRSAPRVKGELQFHAKGCYSLSSMVKTYNRRAENRLLSTEAFGVMRERLASGKYDVKKAEKLWKKLFFCQFHDNLAGTVTKPATEDMRNVFGGIISECDELTHRFLSEISWKIDTLQGNPPSIFREDRFFPFVHEKLGSPVVVFNSLPFPVKQAVMIYPKCSGVTDYDGNAVPSQLVRGYHTDGYDNIYSTVFFAEIPAYGYKTFKIFKEKRVETENSLIAGEDYLENETVRVTFNLATAGIKSILDKRTGAELFVSPTEIVTFHDEKNDSWAHGSVLFDEPAGKFTGVEMHVIERGPARATMRMTAELNGSIVRQDFSIVPGSDVLYVKVRINAREKHRGYRWKFPILHGENARSVCDVPYGTIERESDGAEYPCGKWFAVYGKEGGVTICNDGKYSYSADENAAYLTAIRTSIYLDHFANVAGTRDEFCDFIDLGESEFTFTVQPYRGVADAVRSAYSLNRRVAAVAETFHGGTLGAEYCAIKTDSENIVATALKKSEDEEAIILRAYECEGRETSAKIHLFGREIKARFGRFEIKTFRILNDKIEETDLLERAADKNGGAN